ncbi:Macrolide 2'-phosphotransferase [Actinomycetales bacterium JB111]|nr:Macrolide 2'-phosphotransferase [Actinomycetales bacterium JB111]
MPGLDAVATRPPVRTTTDFQISGVLDGRGRHWVVRMPRTAAAGASLEAEVALLDALATQVDSRRLGFEVERPAGFAPLSEGGRAMVTRELPGRPAEPTDVESDPALGADLGRSLAALHLLDTDIVGAAGLPVYDMGAYRRRRLAEVDEAAKTGDLPPELVHRWEEALEDDSLWPKSARVVHGDLDAELVRISDSRVVALQNFADAHVGDPAEDFAWLASSVQPEVFDAVTAAWAGALGEGADADPYLADRAQLTSELLLVRWLMFGRRAGDSSVVADARTMLDELATDVASSPPIGDFTRRHLAAGSAGFGGGFGGFGAGPDGEHESDDDWDDEDWPEDEDDEEWPEDVDPPVGSPEHERKVRLERALEDLDAQVDRQNAARAAATGGAVGAGSDSVETSGGGSERRWADDTGSDGTGFDDTERAESAASASHAGVGAADADETVEDESAEDPDHAEWPQADARPGRATAAPGIPEPTAATADLSEEYEQWRREGREF